MSAPSVMPRRVVARCDRCRHHHEGRCRTGGCRCEAPVRTPIPLRWRKGYGS